MPKDTVEGSGLTADDRALLVSGFAINPKAGERIIAAFDRLSADQVSTSTVEQEEIDVAVVALKAKADSSGYGHWITDAAIRETAVAVVTAIEKYRAAPSL